MPSLTLPITANGPVIEIYVGVSGPRGHALTAAGLVIPPPLNVRMLIDTGASCTCLDASVIARLGITSTGVVPVHTPSTGAAPASQRQFDVAIGIPCPLPTPGLTRTLAAVAVLECDFSAQGGIGLLGRDVLANGIFFYNGTTGDFTLSF